MNLNDILTDRRAFVKCLAALPTLGAIATGNLFAHARKIAGYSTKENIYGMANKYMVFAAVDDKLPGGYDHSGYLILVDKDKHIRGAYDGTNEDQVNLLLKDLATLLKE